MSNEEPDPNPLRSPPVLPIGLAYANPEPRSPGSITVIAVIGICIAVLGLLSAASGTLTAAMGTMMSRAQPTLQWQTSGAAAVTLCEAATGAMLAVTLFAGSTGLLRLRPWSRRVMLWWSVIYCLNALLFLSLQILIVVPSQMSQMASFMRTLPTTAPTTSPASTVAGPFVATSTVTVTSVSGSSVTTTTSPAFPAGTPLTMPMTAVMRMAYIYMAVGKTIVCLIFPIVVFVLMLRPTIREALVQLS